ncbi:biotin/lipoyl-binding protein [Synechococcus sp. W60.1]|uniref:efflux RND transporter periplasmic adaptor subunit n=1 Tax=Synechococcus sp. W60.1 TaxID=2964516 RepID=UPI0039C3C95F
MQLRTALPLLCLSLLVAACRPGGPPRSMGGEGGGEGQPTPVAVGRVEEQQIEETSEFMASLGSQQVASIRPQVSGQVTRVLVQLGSQVAAGAPLFEIDSRQQQAAVAGQTAGIAAAQANLESGRAVLSQLRADRLRLEAAAEFAREQHERNLRLLAEGAISQAQADQSSRDLRQAEAALAAQQEQIRAQEAATCGQSGRCSEPRPRRSGNRCNCSFSRLQLPLPALWGMFWCGKGTT